MGDLPEFGAKATINLTDWDRQAAAILADAARIDLALDALSAKFASLGVSLELPDIDVSVDATVDETAIDNFAAALEGVPDSIETDLSAVDDTSGVDDFIEAVDTVPDEETTGLDADSDTSGIDEFIEAVEEVPDSETTAIDVEADTTALDAVILAFDELPEEVPVVVTPQVEPSGLSMLDSLALKLTGINSTIELIQKGFGLLGSGVDLAGQLVKPIVDADDAMAYLESHTGRAFPEMEEEIKKMYSASDSASQAQIAQVMAAGIQWNMAEDQIVSTTGAVLDFADTWDKDALTVLATFDSMIKSGMVSDATEAFDLLTYAMIEGADKGGDLLTTITNNAGALKEMGFTGQEVVSGIISGMEAGLPGASSVIDMIRGLVRGEGGAGTEAIDILGLGDEQAAKDAGTITGGEYVTAVLAALSEQAPDVQKEMATKLFGRAAGMTGVSNILGLDFAQDVTDEIVGVGAAAAAAADDTIHSAMTILSNTISVEVADILNSKFDIQGWLDKIKGAVQTFSAEIQAGEGLFGALEIALAMPGLEQTAHQIESAINNFLIGLLQAVAQVGGFLGADVSGMNKEITRISAGQLAFDLTIATDEDEIRDVVQRAIDRGVSGSTLSSIFTETINTYLGAGELSKAQAFFSTLEDMANWGEDGSTLGQQVLSDTDWQDTTGRIAKLQDKIAELKEGWLVEPGASTETGQLIAGLEKDIASETMFRDFREKFAPTREQIAQVADDMMTQLSAAIAAKDWGLATAIGDQMNVDVSGIVQEGQFKSTPMWSNFVAANMPTEADIAQSWKTALNNMNNALAMGDVSTAAGWAETLINANDPAVQGYVRDQASVLYQLLTTAMQEGDVAGQADVLSILGLGDADLQAATENIVLTMQTMRVNTETETLGVTTAVQNMQYSITTNADMIQWDLQDTGTEVLNLNTSVQTNIPKAQSTFAGFLTSIVTGSNPALSALAQIAAQFKDLAESAAAITGAGAKGGGGGAGGHQHGGLFSGTSLVGEAGPELVSTDQRLSVLNARSTAGVMSGLQAILAGNSPVSVNAPRTNQQNNQYNFYPQSEAQTTSNLLDTVNAIRGFSA